MTHFLTAPSLIFKRPLVVEIEDEMPAPSPLTREELETLFARELGHAPLYQIAA